MSHPVLWTKKSHFHPLGSTPPTCFTQDLPPELPAKVLLLGCGDPRSILYTIFAGTKPSTAGQRVLDFTCCDNEPAILARNALLFTLFFDGCSLDLVWNIFYHFRIDAESFSLLISQCKKLASISGTLDLWRDSPYSHFLRICNHRTLSLLHDHWHRYTLAQTFTERQHQIHFDAFIHEYQAHSDQSADYHRVKYSTSRSSGPFWSAAAEELAKNHEWYRKTGNVIPTQPSTATTSINPTFLHMLTGEGCPVPYWMYPLHGFHIASAYAASSTSSAATKHLTAHDLVASAKHQFGQWCKTFKAAVSPNLHKSVIIRFFSGDALAFCCTLYHCHVTSSTSASLYASPWSGDEVVLDGRDYDTKGAYAAPTLFNVIDTLDLVDHVGLMNSLISAIPLLSHQPSSTLYTKTFLASARDTASGFLEQLCGNIADMSLLIGAAPVAYLTGFASYSNIHELVRVDMANGSHYHQCITWKIPSLSDSHAFQHSSTVVSVPSFQPQGLAKLLFNIYRNMFMNERVATGSTPPTRDFPIHYHRGTYAALLELVKSRVQTDWNSMMGILVGIIEADQSLNFGCNFYQELLSQFYVRGVHCVPTMQPDANTFIFLPESQSSTIFEGWLHLSPLVCLILVIPKEKVKLLQKNMTSNSLPKPTVQCEICNPDAVHDIYSSIQFVFGTISVKGKNSGACAFLAEDKAGWSGSSSLIMSIWVPSISLALESSLMEISLSLWRLPATSLDRANSPWVIFTTCLTNCNAVYIVSHRPNCPCKLSVYSAASPHSPTRTSVPVSADVVNEKISLLSARWDVPNIAPNDSVDMEQVLPCIIKIDLGRVLKELLYPFPIDASRAKLCVAQKSGWIEVVAPLFEPTTSGNYSLNRFPVILFNGTPIPWNTHQIQLHHQPAMDLNNVGDKPYIHAHLLMSVLDRECSIQRERRVESQLNPSKIGSIPGEVLAQLKASMTAIFFCMSPAPWKSIFVLDRSSPKTCTTIFLNQLCLDIVGCTVVADICVLPPNPHFVDGEQLNALFRTHPAI